jgi:hypothetical protein
VRCSIERLSRSSRELSPQFAGCGKQIEWGYSRYQHGSPFAGFIRSVYLLGTATRTFGRCEGRVAEAPAALLHFGSAVPR